MATKTINDYTAAVTIDASNDYYLLEQGGVYKRINRNVGLGLASAPLGTTDSQSPQNKTFDNTNVMTIKDGNFTLQNSSSTTKQAVFSASGITAGQTRTFTFPDASGTLATIAGTQTLTNKTITSPTITGGSIDNSTITVDSIAGHTTGTIVTVANLQISNGVLNSANAVTATSIANGAIQPQALVAGTGSGWAWQSWTPTWTNFTAGNAVISSQYVQTGKSVMASLFVTLGSTSSVTGLITFSLPVTANSRYTNLYNIGQGVIFTSSFFPTYVLSASATTATIQVGNAGSTYTVLAGTSATVPTSFAATNYFSAMFYYEAA